MRRNKCWGARSVTIGPPHLGQNLKQQVRREAIRFPFKSCFGPKTQSVIVIHENLEVMLGQNTVGNDAHPKSCTDREGVGIKPRWEGLLCKLL